MSSEKKGGFFDDQRKRLRQGLRMLSRSVRKSFESSVAGTINDFGRLASPLRFLEGLEDWDWITQAHIGNDQSQVNITFKACQDRQDHWLVQNALKNIYSYSLGIEGLSIETAMKSGEKPTDAQQKQLNEFKSIARDLFKSTDLESMVKDILREPVTSGEVFLLFEPDLVKFQLIDSQRIKTPSNLRNDKNVIDGVRRDDRGFVIGYYIDKQLIPVQQVVFKKYGVSVNSNRGRAEMWPLVKQKLFEKIDKNLTAISDVTILKSRIPGIVSYPAEVDAADFGSDLEKEGDYTLDLTQEINQVSDNNLRLNIATHIQRGIKKLQWLFVPDDYQFAAPPFASVDYNGSIKIIDSIIRICGARFGQPPHMIAGVEDSTGFGSSGLDAAGTSAKQRFVERSAEAAKVVAECIGMALKSAYGNRFDQFEVVVTGKEFEGNPKDKRELVFGAVDRGIMSNKTAREKLGLNDETESENISKEDAERFDSDSLTG